MNLRVGGLSFGLIISDGDGVEEVVEEIIVSSVCCKALGMAI